MKLQRITLISILVLIIIFTITMEHFLPVGILLIPLITVLALWFIVFTNNSFNIIIKSGLCYLFIGLTDIGVKRFLYGGVHGNEDFAWINLILIIDITIGFIMLAISIFKDDKERNWMKLISILIFILLTYTHYQAFRTLGIQMN